MGDSDDTENIGDVDGVSDGSVTDDVAATIGQTLLDDRPWDFLTDLTAIENRMAGSAGEAEAAALVADVFRDAGVTDIRQQSFEMQHWIRGEAELELVAPHRREFEAIALPYSPPDSLRGELVDVGYGTPAEIDAVDVEDRIVVASATTPPETRFIHRMEKFNYAVKSGAKAFVFVNHKAGQLPPTGALRFDEEAPAPAVGVSKETGAWLREYAAESGDGGTAVRDVPGDVRLTVDADTSTGTSQNVLGEVGPETDDELLVLAHYDAHDIGEGALDNGCGIATVVTAARILTGMDLDRRVRLAAVGCEELGLMGSEHLAATTDLDSVHAVVNVDGAGRFRNLVAMTHTSETTADVARTVEQRTSHPIAVDEEPHPFSDQWPFVRQGVPALQLHSESHERGRGWGHTAADTRDKVDSRNIREHAILTALLVQELAAREEIPRIGTTELRDAFRDMEFEVGMRAADLWPAAWDETVDGT